MRYMYMLNAKLLIQFFFIYVFVVMSSFFYDGRWL